MTILTSTIMNIIYCHTINTDYYHNTDYCHND